MFDVTGIDTPLLLFAPDLARYDRQLRGFYFDLIAEAPVPVLQTRDEVLAELARLAHHPGPVEPTPALSRWRERFTPRDDRAAERVVARIIESGMLESS
jgi:CDP-glycerol glycerophosphotransferase (TagB/SpsB family)